MNQNFKKTDNSYQNLPKNDKNKSESDSTSKSKTDPKFELDVPPVPEVPKQKGKLTINSPGLSNDLLEKIKKLKTKSNKVVLVNCERCRSVIPIPIPKKVIEKSELPIVPVSFVHKNPRGDDLHNITIHLDHDFDVRRQRISDVIISSD
ncbi:MAG: hypothetical protein ACFE9P_07015 [Candidatus Hermodarchaeota archaeon]